MTAAWITLTIIGSVVLAVVLDRSLARARRWLRIRTQVMQIEAQALDVAFAERIREGGKGRCRRP